MVTVNSSEVGSTMEREREREMEVDEEEEITVVVEGRDKVKGPWSLEEDTILSRLVSKFGARNWTLIARRIAGRSGKSCRLRWCNQLDPTVKRKPFTGLLHLHLHLQLHFHYFQNFGCFSVCEIEGYTLLLFSCNVFLFVGYTNTITLFMLV